MIIYGIATITAVLNDLYFHKTIGPRIDPKTKLGRQPTANAKQRQAKNNLKPFRGSRSTDLRRR
jgi:hypothetical protein